MVLSEGKLCPKCGHIQPTDEFYRDAHTSNGLSTYCRTCQKQKAAMRRQTKRSHVLTRLRDYYAANREYCQQRARLYWRSHRAERYAYGDRERRTPRGRARIKLMNAVWLGKIEKPSRCETCGSAASGARLHGHHEDYSRPLVVVWLCAICHGLRHRLPLERN